MNEKPSFNTFQRGISMTRFLAATSLLAFIVGAAPTTSFGQGEGAFANLLPWVPPSANQLVLLDVKGFYNSAFGKAENLKKQHQADFEEGISRFPPTVDQIVLAAETRGLSHDVEWEIGIANLNATTPMEEVAQREQGELDEIQGKQVVWSARNLALVKLGPKLVGIQAPADRQGLSRWLRDRSSAKKPTLSPYLSEAASVGSEGAQFVAAFDLEEALAVPLIRQAIEQSEAMKEKKIDLDKAAQTLSSVRGVTFAVRMEEDIVGKLRVDFGAPLTSLEPVAKQLVLEALSHHGLYVDDFESWKLTLSSRSVSLAGPLSRSGMRQIGSMITLPGDSLAASTSAEAPTAATKAASEQSRAAAASQKYYKAVVHELDELRDKPWKTQGQNAFFHEKSATKLDRLPILNVDEELLAYGGAVANALRDVSVTMKGAGVRKGVRAGEAYASGATTGYGYGYGNYGRNASHAQSAQKLSISRQERAKGTTAEIDQWSQIDSWTAEVRKNMTAKYQVEF